MSVCELENDLFAEWKVDRESFVSDGIVSKEDYLKSELKITFILKEVNSKTPTWDLRSYLNDGARPKTWDNVSRWVHGIRNLENEFQWDFYNDITLDFRKKQLKAISSINLKKSAGTHTTDNNILETEAKIDQKFTMRQYQISNPDLTICGGTGDLFKEVLCHKSKWKRTSRGVWWYEREPKKYVIAFSHPAARVSDHILLYSLLDAVREIYA